MGTRLIGHCPHIAPQAYLHVLYAPLSEEELQEFRERIGRPVNHELDNFYRFVNGIMIYSGAIRVLGYVPLKRKSNTQIYNYPSNIIIPNVSARIKGLSDGAIIIGFYQADGSYASIEENGCVVRFDAKGDGSLIQKWPSFENWLSSEVIRLDSEQKMKVH
ncbi:MAG: SMI1/KNR4 family protein [Cellvibrio sp.]|nr:SMI1/KNR4 family protein [Cellvibrio sp.]